MEKHEKIDETSINLETSNAPDTGVKIDDIDTLKELTHSQVIEIASGDIIAHIQDYEKILEILGKGPGTYYRDIIFALVHIRLPEEEAKRDWEEILRHKYTMSETLDRNVGIHVATLDYYTNVKRRMSVPKILDVHEYADTASRAITDELTRAYNRGYFDEEFSRLFTKTAETGGVFSLIMLDLDHFKRYNDINGHIRGDIALMETVRILHAVCRAEDIVARYGGEEFVVLLPQQDLHQAIGKAEHIRNAVYEYRFVNEQELPGGRLSVSCGVTSFRTDMTSAAEMLDEADVALYRAKNGGRNVVKSFLKDDTE